MSMSDDQSAAPGGPHHLQQGQQPAQRHGEQPPVTTPPSQPYPQPPPETYVEGRGPDIDLRDRSHDDLDPSTTPIPPVYAHPPPPSYAQQPVQQPVQQPPPQAPPQGARRSKTSVPDSAARFARQRLGSPEARRLFGRSEFVLTICGAVLLILAAAIQQNFDAPQMWTLFTLLFVGYVVSRGIAKAGSDKSD